MPGIGDVTTPDLRDGRQRGHPRQEAGQAGPRRGGQEGQRACSRPTARSTRPDDVHHRAGLAAAPPPEERRGAGTGRRTPTRPSCGPGSGRRCSSSVPTWCSSARSSLAPIVYGLWISLHQWDFLLPGQAVRRAAELRRPVHAAGRRPRSRSGTRCGPRRSSRVLSVPLLMVLPLALAVALNKKFHGRNAVRAIFFAPFVLGVAVIGLLWRYLLDPNVGVINYYLDQLGFDRIPFTTATPWVWLALVVPTIWWTAGYNMVIFLAGLQDISRRALRGGRARRGERVAALPPRDPARAAAGDRLRPHDHHPRLGQPVRSVVPHHPGPAGRRDPQRHHADRRGGPAPVQHGQRLGHEHRAHRRAARSSAWSACRSCGSAPPRRRRDEHRDEPPGRPTPLRPARSHAAARRIPWRALFLGAARPALPHPAAVDGDDVAEVHGRGLAGRPHLPAEEPDHRGLLRPSSAPRRRRSPSGSSTR